MPTRIFDTDHHVTTPPPDMWTSRMPKKYQDDAPRVVDLPDGGQAWSFDGGAIMHLFGLRTWAGASRQNSHGRPTTTSSTRRTTNPRPAWRSWTRDGIEGRAALPIRRRPGGGNLR